MLFVDCLCCHSSSCCVVLLLCVVVCAIVCPVVVVVVVKVHGCVSAQKVVHMFTCGAPLSHRYSNRLAMGGGLVSYRAEENSDREAGFLPIR